MIPLRHVTGYWGHQNTEKWPSFLISKGKMYRQGYTFGRDQKYTARLIWNITFGCFVQNYMQFDIKLNKNSKKKKVLSPIGAFF